MVPPRRKGSKKLARINGKTENFFFCLFQRQKMREEKNGALTNFQGK
jgi:hypothetical protein